MYYNGGSTCCQNSYPSYGYPMYNYGYYGGNNFGSSYAIVLVLFILLVIVIGSRYNR